MDADRTWTIEEIRFNLLTDPTHVWVERAVLAIYNKQTSTEQVIGDTKYKNGVGFSGSDAAIMSSFATWLLKKKGNRLSPKQFAIAQKKIVKYTKQLVKIANGEI